MSSAGMPELGSKISLISKADIRYEGRLFTVDPQECTIALANVRSFGTEDRETPYPIMPQPTVYDYILFRGSDIKDIRVVNNVAIPNDPAIMQMHLPPGQMPPQQNFTPQNFPPMQGQPGAPQMAQFGPFGGMQAGNMGGMPPQQPPPQQAQSPVQQGNGNNNLAPGSGQKNKKSNSRSGTPQNSRKSPTSDMGVQTNQGQRGDGQAGGNKDKPQRNNQRNNQQGQQQQQQQRERRDSARNEGQENKGGYRNQNQRPNNQMNNNNQQQQQNRGGYNNNRDNNRDNRNGGGDNRNNNQNQNQMRGNNQGGSARMRGPPMHMNQNYNRQQNNQGAPIQNNQNKPNNNGPQQQNNRSNSKPLKFENEFDFETSNSKFEELRAQLAKLKVGSEETKAPEQVNGEVEKKDDSGNETGADNHEAEVDDSGYDKNKSFFDNISCEAVERSKGKTQRTDWRQERKINSETFGYSSYQRRGNYRGGRGGYYRGGNPNYRPQYHRGGNPNYRPSNYRNHRQQSSGDGRNPPQGGNNGQQQSQSAPVAAN